MHNKAAQSVIIKDIKDSGDQQKKKKKFCERFTCENIFKILYLLLAVSFGHGLFALIIYFISNKKYGLILVIGAVFSGTLHFLYESYKVLFAEELLIKKIILKNKIKKRLIKENRYEYNNYLYNYIIQK